MNDNPRLICVLASALRMIPGAYETPEAAAEGLIRRLRYEGFEIVDENETKKKGDFW